MVLRRNEDPAQILGVSPEASPEEVRAAYLDKVKAHPPDRDPENFERVRDAYEILRDPRRRVQRVLLSADPEEPIASLVDGVAEEREFVGPGPWLDALRCAREGGATRQENTR